MRIIDHMIAGGGAGAGGGSVARSGDVYDPNSGQVQARVSLGGQVELDRAVAAAQGAQPAWAMTNPQRRARVMFRFKELVEQNMDALARLLSSEHGKVIADSKGSLQESAFGVR